MRINRTANLNIRVTEDFKKKLREYAELSGMKFSEFVLRALELGVNELLARIKNREEMAKQLKKE